MGPATAGFADATTHHQHIDNATVDHIHVVPVVNRRTEDHHGFTFGFVRVICKFTCKTDNLLTVDLGNLFLPCRGIRHVIIIGTGNVFATQALVHTIICHLQIKYCGYQATAAIGQGNSPGGNISLQNTIVISM